MGKGKVPVFGRHSSTSTVCEAAVSVIAGHGPTHMCAWAVIQRVFIRMGGHITSYRLLKFVPTDATLVD